jgi:DNA-binding NtrC family response regulator
MAGHAVDTGNVRALRRPRVLVAASDRTFLRVARFLLRRHGLDAGWTQRPRELLDALERERPDIVILDASDSLTQAAQLVGAIEALHRHVTVVVVADDPGETNGTLQVFAKWTSLETLVLKLEAMHLSRERF